MASGNSSEDNVERKRERSICQLLEFVKSDKDKKLTFGGSTVEVISDLTRAVFVV